MIRKLGRMIKHPIKNVLLRDVYQKLEQLEYRSFNRRFYAIEQTSEYLIGAKIPGDYLEFGVFKGTTFSHAFKMMSEHFKEMKFIAFDSFAGLPAPAGIDADQGYSSSFFQAQFTCSQEEFEKQIQQQGVDLKKVVIVKGWFDQTLLPGKASQYGIEKIAVAWIDCDLYESTVPVLEFITPHVTTGSVIVFDDWRCFRNHPDFGEQRAAREWLAKNPRLALSELFSFGWNGTAFTVTSC